ncbi:M15 family metallopeptidase [Microvirga sp. ACRRW]|uniref:M15 family metallopeptidase n=1 Tax=Microvirga sp. ACRRW TaxID=2918205 RepID=UPI001EF5C60A|nr:M15 family metallopeptidase [Microvirga sp. ACRRW]MCG7393253.1 M15 family metallopeptidase [Microvirga sp. ACRRW]
MPRGRVNGLQGAGDISIRPFAWAVKLLRHSLRFGVLIAALLGVGANAVAQQNGDVGQRAAAGHSYQSIFRPEGIYAKIPERDDQGRDQRAMFRAWNPDPVGNHEANLRALHPLLARVVQKAQADNPGLAFVIGSGLRDGSLQRKAVAWGWSRTNGGPHVLGLAVDLWPLDAQGHVVFDPSAHNRIAAAMKRAARELGVPILWGGHFQSFKDADRSHFELRRP